MTRGRYQPFGNHHAAVFNYFADKDDADTVYVFADDTHGERLPTSPATGEEVAEMIEASYENDYEVDFDVEAVPHDGLNPLSYSGPLSVLGEDPVFFTREEEFAEKAKTWSDVLSYLGVDMDVDYEPREDHTPFERFPGEVETSSTNIRQSILNGDEWRAYVSDSVEDFVNESDEFQEALVPEEDQNPSKHKDLVKSRVPGL